MFLTSFQKKVLANLKEKIKTGMYRFENVACLCGSCNVHLIANTDRYGLQVSIVICSDCGLVRMNPRLDAASLEMFYRQEYRDLYMGPEYGNMDNYLQGMVARGETMVSLIDLHAPGLHWKTAKVLEVGCSVGGNLVPFLRRGAMVRGYDYDARYLDYGKKVFPDLDLRIGGVDDLVSDKGRYDLIIFNHVLEHLADPRKAFQLAAHCLSQKGIMYVSVPGLRNPEFYFSPTKSILGGFHIAHLYYFTALTLRHVTAGFEPLYVDESVRSLMRRSVNGNTYSFVHNPEECNSTIAYIRRYESQVISRYYLAGALVIKSWLARVASAFSKLIKYVARGTLCLY